MMKAWIFVAAACAGLAPLAAAAQDSYQWLEAPTDARALAWAKERTGQAQAKIAALPDRAAIESELRKVLVAGDPPPDFTMLGPVALRFQRSAERPHGVLSVAARGAGGKPGGWRAVLDVDALRRTEGKPYELRFGQEASSCLAPEYRRCIVSLSPEGGDAVELREFDLVTGQFVGDGFRAPAGRNFAVWFDKDHLLVQHTIGDAPKLATGWSAATYLWKRGTPLAAAREIYRAGPNDALTMVGVSGTGPDRAGVILRALDYSTIEYHLVRSDGAVEKVPLPQKVKMGLSFGAAPRIVVQLGEEATIAGQRYPAETVLAYETAAGVPADRRLSVVHSPRDGEFVADPYFGIAASRTKVRMVLARRGVSRIATFARRAGDWTQVESQSVPVGTSVTLGAADPASDHIIVRRAGFLLPASVELIGNSAPLSLFTEKPAFDPSGFRVELKTARSKDGTEIDYFLLRPATAAKVGATPTLMTGYGAFGITLSPGYLDGVVGGRALVPWLNRGGALVLPLIRGGGERGEAWHQAAIRDKRQNSYDDFIAVTEALIRDGFTTPQHIGVFGSSNGGLLAAVMGTQRPDLFGAIVSDVPLTDLVRMPFMGMGAAWVNEYGDANDPAMRAVLERYSPYQRVKPGVRYPRFLVTVATSDNRVGPGHARKLAARLEEVGAPVFYLEDQEGGHGVSDPLTRPELMADRMTFLIDALR